MKEFIFVILIIFIQGGYGMLDDSYKGRLIYHVYDILDIWNIT